MSQITISKTVAKFTALVLFLGVLGVWVYFRGVTILAFSALIIFIWALSYYLQWGWYVLVALSPFINWEIYLSSYRQWFEQYPIIARMHAPAVEFWAILMLGAFAVDLVRRIFTGQKFVLRFPVWKFFALFVLSAFISIVNLAPWDKGGGVKYILHFILLFYFGYLFLGANIISSKKIWENSLRILAGAGILSALMGAVSLVMGVWQYGGFRRAVPFALGSWAPLGFQHIFLAEVLTVAFPIAVYFWCKNRPSRFWSLSALFILIIGLLTLSRAGWVTFLVNGIIFWLITRLQVDWKEMTKKYSWLLVVVIPIIFYLGYFLFTSSTVSSSNSARMEIARIAWFSWLRHPLIGNGVGSFVPTVGEVYSFVLDFGDPTDALGIVQKLGAEMGLLGIVAFGLFVWQIIKRIRRSGDRVAPENLLALFLVSSPLVFQLFNTQFYSSKMWVPIALGLCVMYVFKNNE